MLHSNRGFTLIEMMAALVLLAVSVVSLAALPIAAVKAAGHARNVTSATNLALDKIEELRGADWATVTSGSDGARSESASTSESAIDSSSSAVYARSWTVTTGPAATKQVTVTVSWRGIGPRQVVLQTVIGE